ncbi:hypothetical protein [Sphingobium sp.]|uniref:hypothetical protein n=1 Tax=Sphingobium sp. TaxID=1912891 RepID=UPI003BB80FEA
MSNHRGDVLTGGRIADLERLIAQMLDEVGVDGPDVGLRLERIDGGLAVSTGGKTIVFTTASQDWELRWDSLARRLVRKAVDARLRTISRERGENRPGPWSIFAPGFAIDWLAWNAGGIRTAAWDTDVETILEAADDDCDVSIRARRTRRHKGLRGSIRERRLVAIRIDLGDAEYTSGSGDRGFPDDHGTIHAREILSYTATLSDDARPLGAYIGHPAITDRDYGLTGVSIAEDGTTFKLEEKWIPFEGASPPIRSRHGSGTAAWELPAKTVERLTGIMFEGACRFGSKRDR